MRNCVFTFELWNDRNKVKIIVNTEIEKKNRITNEM